MLTFIERIERLVVYFLVTLLLTSVVLGTLSLGVTTIRGILVEPIFLIDMNNLFESFALFLVIIVGLELIKSIKSYLITGSINPAFVVEVAIIALGNKLITLDLKHIQPDLLYGIAAILIGLSVTYIALKKACTED